MSEHPDLYERRIELRQNSTATESLLWGQLRDRRVVKRKFRRQHQIGPYIVDFFCSYAALVVEVDGSQHLESRQRAADERRTEFLRGQGLTVLRFTNAEIATNMDGVLETIRQALESTPSPALRAPSPSGEREDYEASS